MSVDDLIDETTTGKILDLVCLGLTAPRVGTCLPHDPVAKWRRGACPSPNSGHSLPNINNRSTDLVVGERTKTET